MSWNRADANLPGGGAAVHRMNTAARRMQTEADRLFRERGWPDVQEWDLEELGRMQPRQPDGSWPRGPRPQWLQRVVREEIRRRFAEEGERQIWMLVPQAIRVLGEVIVDPHADVQLKTRCAMYVIDQGLGRATTRIEAEVTEKATGFLADRVVLDDGADAHPVIRGEFTDDDQEESDKED